MACRRSTLRFLHPSTPTSRTFTTTPARQRLGAATYAQEWNNGTYHFNKSTSKLVPFAHKQTDKLLQQYLTQQKKNAGGYANKAAIASHRRRYEKMYISGSRVKDFGGKVEVEAFVFDGAAAAKKEQAVKEAKTGKVAPGKGQQGGQGARGRQGGQGAQGSKSGGGAR